MNLWTSTGFMDDSPLRYTTPEGTKLKIITIDNQLMNLLASPSKLSRYPRMLLTKCSATVICINTYQDLASGQCQVQCFHTCPKFKLCATSAIPRKNPAWMYTHSNLDSSLDLYLRLFFPQKNFTGKQFLHAEHLIFGRLLPRRSKLHWAYENSTLAIGRSCSSASLTWYLVLKHVRCSDKCINLVSHIFLNFSP